VDLSPRTSLFGRYEFVIRRFHSLTGLVPVGGFVIFHLATNASVLDGPSTFQSRVDQIHQIGPTTLFMLEWAFIFLPILFHGLIGMAIVIRGKRNLADYPYTGNFRYTLQRWTGVLAMTFIVWHVFHMHGWFRFEWWAEHVAQPLGGAQFDPHNAAVTAGAAIFASALMTGFYAAGVLACVYHLANGLWTMGITWGVWTSPRAQRWANVPCVILGLFVAIVGMGALYGFQRVDRSAPRIPTDHVHRIAEARMDGQRPAPSAPLSAGNPDTISRGRNVR